MTKKRVRPHKPPPWYLGPRPEPISERYQAEVDAATNRLEKQYAAAQRRLEQAQDRRARAERKHATRTQLAALEREVEARLREVAELERLMMPGNNASAAHRGTRSHRPAPPRS